MEKLEHDIREEKDRARTAKFDAEVAKRPVKDYITLRDLQETTAAAIEKYREKWLHEKKLLDEMVHEATVNKTSLPNNYYIAEHRARAHYASAVDLLELLK